MARTSLLAGNWKMYLSQKEAADLASKITSGNIPEDREVLLAPPAISLQTVGQVLASSKVQLASQNICWAENGAFTGEISPIMLKEVGGSMAIIGHSERRQIFAETDELINKRVLGALDFNLIPILCIGETLEERESDKTLQVLEDQLRNGLINSKITNGGQIVVAYEPVWAIGTGKTASTEQAQDAHKFIRSILADIYQKDIAEQIRILYGGSVNPTNVDELMSQPDVDGALVGGAALKPDSFLRIINYK